MKSFLPYLFILFTFALTAQNNQYQNPIYSGGYPDPSICRVGEDYYIINSSFEYYPGLPIHHSKDLVNWKLVGYGLYREEQCTGVNNLIDVQQRGGIHAPTIRHHNGKFYIITTNVYSPKDKIQPTQFINFIITADNIKGPWSEPHHLEGAPGIDPDIFFDDDGKVWYVGTHAPEKPNFNGEGEIWLQEIDLENWKLKGERYFLWRGACGGTWAEGPHIYKKDGKYYLLIAEGGTSFNHAVMIAQSDDITGPYAPNDRNPILTTRHLSYDNWINSTGHADMVELPDGRWYMVALGIRGDVQRTSNMGRETHLIPMTWEQEPFEWKKFKPTWPVIAPKTGTLDRFHNLPFQDQPQYRNNAFYDHFEKEKLHLEWNFRRVPLDNTYSLSAQKGHLRLYLKPNVIALRERYSLMGFRQKETYFEYTAKMNFKPKKEKEEAGVSVFLQDDNYILFTIDKNDNQPHLKLVTNRRNEDVKTVKHEPIKDYNGSIIFKIIAKKDNYQYLYSLDDGQSFQHFATTANDIVLCNGYTGAYLGIYATSNGAKTKNFADFDWVQYKDSAKLDK